MMQQARRDEAKERCDELPDAALRGEEVSIAGEGAVPVRLATVEAPPKRRGFGSARGLFTMADDFDDPLPDFEEYMR